MLTAANGTAITALGGAVYLLSDDITREAQAETLPDGRPRLPPGQRVIEKLKPMGGDPGSPSASAFRVRIHGAVEKPMELDFPGLLGQGAVERPTDVHCVTGWSVLGAKFFGVPISQLAQSAKLKPSARFLILEAAHGYSANVRLEHALATGSMLTWQLDGSRLAHAHGGPVRGLIPSLYFWKSAKWITGLRFSEKDEPGYWEQRGYSSSADPWKEERYA